MQSVTKTITSVSIGVAVTRKSPDGAFIYYLQSRDRGGLWRQEFPGPGRRHLSARLQLVENLPFPGDRQRATASLGVPGAGARGSRTVAAQVGHRSSASSTKPIAQVAALVAVSRMRVQSGACSNPV